MTDDELMAALTVTVGNRDPAPPTLQAAARDAFGLGRLADELAELVGDTALEQTGARGVGEARMLSFRVGDVEADVQVTTGAAGAFDVTGMVSGGVAAISVETPDGIHDVPVDENGRFRRSGLTGRMLRLAVLGPTGRTAATSWVLLA